MKKKSTVKKLYLSTLKVSSIWIRYHMKKYQIHFHSLFRKYSHIVLIGGSVGIKCQLRSNIKLFNDMSQKFQIDHPCSTVRKNVFLRKSDQPFQSHRLAALEQPSKNPQKFWNMRTKVFWYSRIFERRHTNIVKTYFLKLAKPFCHIGGLNFQSIQNILNRHERFYRLRSHYYQAE